MNFVTNTNSLLRFLTPVFFICINLSACAYRFTNIAMKPPPGVQSIAVEPVYDTSREVISHELLWHAIQAEFARNGRIQLTTRDQADALMTVHIEAATIAPSGSPTGSKGTVDPNVEGRQILNDPYSYKQLNRAGFSTNTESISYQVNVKVHNLFTKEVIFDRDYTASGSFRSVRAESVATANTGYILYDEALDTRTASISDYIARRIVTDFLL